MFLDWKSKNKLWEVSNFQKQTICAKTKTTVKMVANKFIERPIPLHPTPLYYGKRNLLIYLQNICIWIIFHFTHVFFHSFYLVSAVLCIVL